MRPKWHETLVTCATQVEHSRPTSVLRGSKEPTTWSICPRACITDITAPIDTPGSPRSTFCRVDREMPARSANSSALSDCISLQRRTDAPMSARRLETVRVGFIAPPHDCDPTHHSRYW